MSAALVMAVVLGASLPATPEGPDIAWNEPNSDATYVARQSATEKGCHLQVIHDADQSVLWESDGCFGGKPDKKFLSKDGKRLMVIAAVPAATGKDAADWRQSTVVWLFEKGVLQGTGVAGQFVKNGDEVRRSVSHFSWLQGVDRVPGVPPRYTESGDGVELDAIDGTHTTMKFAGLKLPPPYMPKVKKHHY